MDGVIVGAGIAGLYCARLLEAAGLSVQVLEAEDRPGGRIRTDVVDGFRLDHGFQVLLTAYPELASALDLPALRLCPMQAGALVQKDERMHSFCDPFRNFPGALRLAFDPVVSWRDKLLVARLRNQVLRSGWESFFTRPEQTTLAFLVSFGFSSEMIETFFRPFFGGVFLERELVTSSRYFTFLFRVFAAGAVAVPAEGMEAIPRQMAARLGPRTLATGVRVERIRATSSGAPSSGPQNNGWIVEAAGMDAALARFVVLANNQPPEQFGLPASKDAAPPRVWNRMTTFYFAAEQAPISEPMLVLNGERQDGPLSTGPINHLAVMSRIAPGYAPPGAELISATVVGIAPQEDDAMTALAEQVRAQCSEWFGNKVRDWRLLAGYPITEALPLTRVVEKGSSAQARLGEGLYACGDSHLYPGIEGALVSARQAAECVLEDLGAKPRS